jgi:mannobiose 2-epimerase
MTGRPHFFDAALASWEFIEKHFIDREYGEWFGRLNRAGVPYAEGYQNEQCKVGPWKCPYHNARACYEMLARLKQA